MDKNILVTQSSIPELNEYIDEIKDIWDSKWLTNNGVKHQQLEVELSKYLNIDNISLVVGRLYFNYYIKS